MAWRIRHKLMLGLGLVGIIVALLLLGTLKGLASYSGAMRTIDNKLEERQEAETLRDEIKKLRIPADSSRERPADLSEKLSAARLAFQAYQDHLNRLVTRRKIPAFLDNEHIKGLDDRFKILEKAVNALRVPHPVGANSTDVAIEELINSITDVINDIDNELHHRIIADAKHDQISSLVIVVAISGFAVLVLIGMLRFSYRWIFYPIRDLELGVSRVARGDFEHTIEVHSGDEIEDLAKAFNDMTTRLRDMYGNLARQVNERSRQLVRSERLAGVGFLAAGVAHEINNPLASIAFCGEALERRLTELFDVHLSNRTDAGLTQEREIVTKYLKMIQDEAFRCKEITQKLLAFSRGGERRREPTDISELVQNVLDMVQHLQSCKGKELIFRPNEKVTAWINGQEIKQVFLNLVVNALESMDDGGTLTITQTVQTDMVELVFSDTGCGMNAEILENIFEPFFTRSKTGKGTGLGLSISHRIVTQHGGDIEATSAGVNMGSTFTIRLPLKPALVQANDGADETDPESEFVKRSMAQREKLAA